MAKAKAKYRIQIPHQKEPSRKKSAVTKAYASGLELVAKRERPRATRHASRSREDRWKPWPEDKKWLPSDETMKKQLGLDRRIAGQIMTRTKADLIESLQKARSQYHGTSSWPGFGTCARN